MTSLFFLLISSDLSTDSLISFRTESLSSSTCNFSFPVSFFPTDFLGPLLLVVSDFLAFALRAAPPVPDCSPSAISAELCFLSFCAPPFFGIVLIAKSLIASTASLPNDTIKPRASCTNLSCCSFVPLSCTKLTPPEGIGVYDSVSSALSISA